MLTALIAGLKLAGGYATVVAGADIARKAVTRLAAGTSLQTPIIEGAETMMGIVDPLNLAGPFDAAQNWRERGFGRMFAAVRKVKRQEKAHDKAIESAAKNADAKASAAEAKAAELEAKMVKLEAQGKAAEARQLANRASSMRKWSALTKRTTTEARAQQNANPDTALAIAQAALELAKNANSPPRSALDGIGEQATEAGKALYTHVVDSINRDEEPDYDKLVAALASGQPTSYDDELLAGSAKGSRRATKHDHAVAGPCCTSCAFGGGCATEGKEVPSEFLAGDNDDDDGIVDELSDDYFASIAGGVTDNTGDRNGLEMRALYMAEVVAGNVDGRLERAYDADFARSLYEIDEDRFYPRNR